MTDNNTPTGCAVSSNLHAELICTASGLHSNSQNPNFWPSRETIAKWAQLMFSAAHEIEQARNSEETAQRNRAAWEESAAEFCRNMEYYRSLVDRIGAMLGDAAYIADDGSRSEDVLRAKVPELVAARLSPETICSPDPIPNVDTSTARVLKLIERCESVPSYIVRNLLHERDSWRQNYWDQNGVRE